MSAVISPSDAVLPDYIRARGRIAARFAVTPPGTRAVELAEGGGYRLKFPKGPKCEAMIVNTAGGIAGGDRLSLNFAVAAGADATLTTQSAEKIYRADAGAATAEIRLSAETGATLNWLPQETILFNEAALERTIAVELAAGARLTMAEMVVCGRTAMGETMTAGHLFDRWTIRREGRLIHAEAMRLAQPAQALRNGATGAGGHAFATLLRFADDAGQLVEPLRAELEACGVDWGVSAWNDVLAVRFVARDAVLLRRAIATVLRRLPDVVVPRIWGW